MNAPLVSIIIPLYNRAGLILETLQSLILQSYPHWEILVVDDQSTDRSFEVAKNAALEDNRIRVCQRSSEPKGAPHCRNIGIEKSRGTYLIFLDSDDLLAPYCLEERVNYFENYSQKDFLVFNSSFFTDKLGDTPILWNTFSDEVDLNRYLKGDTVWCISSPIWKRESIIENRLNFIESARSSQDWEFHVKALFKKMSYEKINGVPDFFVRRNPQQAKNAISTGHGNFDKLLNRIELYKILVENFKFTEKQCQLLSANIDQEIFNSYRNFSLKQLKLLFGTIQTVGCFKTHKYQQYWYGLLSVGSRLTYNKSHQLFYFYRRYKAKNQTKPGYRSMMPDEMQNQLKRKLKTFKSTVVKDK